MKKLFIIGLFIACNANIDAFNLNNKNTDFKAGKLCGNCGGECGPKKPEIV